MIPSSTDIYADEYQSVQETFESVRRLNEYDKGKNENVNSLEDLFMKSRRLQNATCIRMIDNKIEDVTLNKKQAVRNLALSCNQLGKSNEFYWTNLPKTVQSLELSGNFLSSLDGVEKDNGQLESIGLAFNDINEISRIKHWSNLCSLDLSYNLLSDLEKTVQSLKATPKLRILFLHGNPISLLVDYRIYIVDALEKLLVLDDIRITAEERFRARTYSTIDRQDKNCAQFQITFGTVQNVPMTMPSQSEWPIQVHRYKMRLDWFDGENQDIDISFDKFANFKRYNQTHLESSPSEYKAAIDFSPNTLNLPITTLVPFRDFLFNGTTCRFIHQLTEYWSPDQVNQPPADSKAKANANRDKKNETPVKKKKNEDLSKLVTLTDPVEKVLAEFRVDLRPFLDGDYQVSFPFKALLQEQIDTMNQQTAPVKSSKKKDGDKGDAGKDKKQLVPPKTAQEKSKDQQTDKKGALDNETDPIMPDPFQCSVQFQLHRYVSKQEII